MNNHCAFNVSVHKIVNSKTKRMSNLNQIMFELKKNLQIMDDLDPDDIQKNLQNFQIDGKLSCPIQFSLEQEESTIAKQLIECGCYDDQFQNEKSETTLMTAILFGETKIGLKLIETELSLLKKTGCKIKIFNGGINIKGVKKIRNINLITGEYPKFATDLQNIFMVCCARLMVDQR